MKEGERWEREERQREREMCAYKEGEEHTSRRHERVRGGKKKDERRYDYQGNSEKKKNPAGEKETECVE